MIAILQPFIPHYREDFFKGLSREQACDIFCYDNNKIKKDGFRQASVNISPIRSIEVKGFLFFNPFTLTSRKYKKLVLMLNIGHLTTWLLLFTKFIHKKDILLWGHGISVKRYLKEKEKPSRLMRWMIKLSDGIWFYTATEQELWKKQLPAVPSVSLNNTISDVDEIVRIAPADKSALKQKHGVREERILIFCARFNIKERRIDLLQQLIDRLDKNRFGFIIIGDGELKPDFRSHGNVYDFGGLYDRKVKEELFQIADIYFQPGWVGLSVVEAMAYGKPVFAFKRAENILQCVEYAYINDGKTGLLFDNIDTLIQTVTGITDDALLTMGLAGKEFAGKYLSMEHMISSGLSLIETRPAR